DALSAIRKYDWTPAAARPHNDARMLKRGLFVLGLIVCCLPWCTPPVALALGLVFGLSGTNPWPAQASRYSKLLLKISVIGLGFGMDLASVVHTGRSTFVYTCIGI